MENIAWFAVVDEVDVRSEEGEFVTVRGDVPETRHVHVRAWGQTDVVDGRVSDGDGRAGL